MFPRRAGRGPRSSAASGGGAASQSLAALAVMPYLRSTAAVESTPGLAGGLRSRGDAGSRPGASRERSPGGGRAPPRGTTPHRRHRGGSGRRASRSRRGPPRAAPGGRAEGRPPRRRGASRGAATPLPAPPPRSPARGRRSRARSPQRARGSGGGHRAPARRPFRGRPAPPPAAPAPSAGPASSSLRQLEQLELHLGDPAAEARQLDALDRAVEERPRLHDADDGPLEVPEHLPPAHGGRIHRRASRALVGGKEVLARAETADGRVGAE